MERSSVQKLARALRALVIVMFVFQIIAMVTRPSYAVFFDGSVSTGEWFNSPKETWDEFFSLYQHDWRRALRWLRVPAWLVIPAWLANPLIILSNNFLSYSDCLQSFQHKLLMLHNKAKKVHAFYGATAYIV